MGVHGVTETLWKDNSHLHQSTWWCSFRPKRSRKPHFCFIAFLIFAFPKHQFLFESFSFFTQYKYIGVITLQRTVKAVQAAEYVRYVCYLAVHTSSVF